MDYLVSEIEKITGDVKSTKFWKKAIRLLGEGPVSEEVGELKYRMHIEEIKKPAQYLTRLLTKRIDQVQENKIASQGKQGEFALTYFEANRETLINKFKTVEIPKDEVAEKKLMEIPYSDKNIPWITTLGAEFFTLSKNKTTSDEVELVLRTMSGETFSVPMIRGRIKPGSRQYGILNVQHGKLFAILKHEWVRRGCEYAEYKNHAAAICVFSISARALAQAIGWEAFGGKHLTDLTNLLYDLKVKPYYIDFQKNGIAQTGYGFSLLDGVDVIDRKTRGGRETVFVIRFSPFVSAQLLGRQVVGRTKDLVSMKSELAFLIRLYIEPRLLSLQGQEYSKTLLNLIDALCLPKASWHKYPKHRKREFEKAIEQVNGAHICTGGTMRVRVEKGLFDYMLVAHIENVGVSAQREKGYIT